MSKADPTFSTTQQRHQKIYQVYCMVIAELGSEARNVSKKSLYLKVAQRTDYTEDHVQKVISRILRKTNVKR